MQIRKPKALLIIYQPNHRFRFKKYFLGQGKNTIGCLTASNVRIVDIQNQLPNQIAIITITQYLMTLQSLGNVVKIMSNMLNKRQAVPLPKGKQFVVEIFKCLVQISPLQQLKMIKNVQNIDYFTFQNQNLTQIVDYQKHHFQNLSQQVHPNKSSQNNQNKQSLSPKSNITQKIPQQGFQPTLRLDDDYYGGFQPTIDLNDYQLPQEKNQKPQTLDKKSYSNQKISLQENNNEIKINSGKPYNLQFFTDKKSNQKSTKNSLDNFLSNNNNSVSSNKEKLQVNSQAIQRKQEIKVPQKIELNPSLQQQSQEISMPDTLNQDQMPATIQEAQDQQTLKKMMKSDSHISKTVPVNYVNQVPNQSALKYKSWEIQRIQKQKLKAAKKIQDFCDMFDINQTEKKQQHQKKQSKQKQQPFYKKNSNQKQQQNQGYFRLHRLKKINHLSQQSQKDKLEIQLAGKKYNSTTQSKASENINRDQTTLKKVAFSNLKVSEYTKKNLKQRGYIPISSPKQDYDLLLIGNQLKRSSRLLCAIMQGKEIKNEAWIYNKTVKIGGKLQGFPWQHIQKIKGRKGKIFNGRYFLSPRIRQQFQNVIQTGGGIVVEDLSKARANQDLNLIISTQDKQIYDKRKHYKKWRIYNFKMIIQSVLVGQEIKQKYLMDDFSFV